jgi:hypothetical protein
VSAERLSARSQRVAEDALREALSRGRMEIEPEDLLAAIRRYYQRGLRDCIETINFRELGAQVGTDLERAFVRALEEAT